MFQVKVNEKFDFTIDIAKNQITVNDSLVILDETTLNSRTNHVLFQHKSYTIEVVELNSLDKIAVIKVNGNSFTVNVKDQFDLLLKQLGMESLTTTKISQIKAPMPGLVLNVLVNSGDEVKKGESLLVLEAMKMENMIKSPTDGTIKNIEIKQGDKVEKNQLLISFI